jgi:cation diffusion facilitator family transporter
MRVIMDTPTRYTESRRVTIMGGVKNIFLATIKIIFGITGHSHALLADGIHSLSDLLIDGLVLIASRFGSKAADHEHPYGHGRIETAATVLLAFILSLAGVGIIWDASLEVFGARVATRPDFYVMVIALLSVIINEILYRYTRRVGERVGSKLLITNAWHHRSDSASSLIVLIGVAGAWLGFMKLDAAAAVIVGLMIVKMAAQFGWSSICELVDTGLDDVTLEKIKQTIVAVHGVRALHQLRTRSVAGSIFLDVHILVDPLISVSEGHFIGQQVHVGLLQHVSGVTDVTVHVDPEDDEVMAPSRDLPSRAEIIILLKQHWHDLIKTSYIEKVVLHYLGGKVHVELRLPCELMRNPEEADRLLARLRTAIADVEIISTVSVYFS